MLSRRGRDVTAALLAVVLACTAGCGSYDFLSSVPADDRLQNKSPSQVYRALRLTFDTEEGGKRKPTGKAIFTFGTGDAAFDVTGQFTFTDIRSTTRPSARMEVKYEATDEQKLKYRELVKGMKAMAAQDDEVLMLPDRLPEKQVFTAHPNVTGTKGIKLVDGFGSTVELLK
jgi:hypothetical protein